MLETDFNEFSDFDDYLAHIGVARRSGRYPWGSGDNPKQGNRDFLGYVEELRRQGLTETQVAEGLNISTSQLRKLKSIAKNAEKAASQSQALRLKESGMSNVAIGLEMGLNESSVRALLNPASIERTQELTNTANFLKDQVAEKTYIDVGAGVEHHMNVSRDKLKTAITKLEEEEGYATYQLKIPQLGTGKETTMLVLAPPGTTQKEVWQNQDKIQHVTGFSEDGGKTYTKIETPRSVSSDRLSIRYAEDGGADADGVVYLRPGVDDISLGGARYAQVRIAVDDSHYIKGMAVYRNDLPDGVDLMFNTNKSDTGNKLDALKPLKADKKTGKIDEDLPFSSIIRQKTYVDANGERKLSAINIVNEEGVWGTWSKNLSSQMLSKQPDALAKAQLNFALEKKKAEYDEIMALTNPTVKKRLLEAYADDADSSAVHLKAAALPRQQTHVILPMNSVKETEIYAPNYRNGEMVVLVRHPHGGPFEIPELRVNNKNPEAKSILGSAPDAVGIHSKVAARLSGADFDGDTVLVIPNMNRAVKTASPLEGLKDFNPQKDYPGYEGMPKMSARTKQAQMGDVSNLITDMTIRGATRAELARAVKHSMVVIDAEKHNLNYKLSARENQIPALKEKYQGRKNAGASTLISLAKSEDRTIPDRKPRTAANGGPIDPVTGKKMYEPTGRTRTDKAGNVVPRTVRSPKMAETDDAFRLSSGTPMEAIYATHANKLKALANTARKEAFNTPALVYSPSAKVVYKNEVDSLNAKLNVARKNAPLERQAQIVARAMVRAKTQADPSMEADELKKLKGVALTDARHRVGANKTRIDIAPREWEAIQAGAISNHKLTQILTETDLDLVKKLATPREATVMTSPVLARAKAMLAAGYTQSEISDALGIPASTLNSSLSKES